MVFYLLLIFGKILGLTFPCVALMSNLKWEENASNKFENSDLSELNA